MTKSKAYALAKYLNTHCDEAHVFLSQIGSGVLCDVQTKDPKTLMSMFFTLIDRTMQNLKRREQDEFLELLARAMTLYVEEEFKPSKREEELSDKQRRKRSKHNEKILQALEAVL